jgi:Cu/Ag efflux protein CusF
MTIAKLIWAGTAALTIIVSSAALADQTLTGVITGLNRLNGTISIQQTQSGTVGANTGGAAEQFKVQDGVSLDAVHAGDRVSYSTTDKGGVKTITKLDRQ